MMERQFLVLVENHDGLMKLKEKCNITAKTADDIKQHIADQLRIKVPFNVELFDPDFEEWVAFRDADAMPERMRVRISRVRNKIVSDEHRRYLSERQAYTDRIIRCVRQDFDRLSKAKNHKLVKSYKERMEKNSDDPVFFAQEPVLTRKERQVLLKSQNDAVVYLSRPRKYQSREKWIAVQEEAKKFEELELRPALRKGKAMMRVKGSKGLSEEEGMSWLRHKLIAASYNTHGQDFRKLFSRFDVNSDGSLSRKELKEALVKFIGEVDEHDLSVVLDHFDQDGDGEISLTEFSKFLKMPTRTKHKSKLQLIQEIVKEHGAEPAWRAQKGLHNEVRQNLQNGRTRMTRVGKGSRHTRPLVANDHIRHRLAAMSYSDHKGQDIESLFAKLDTNKDSVLSQQELEQVLVKILGEIDEKELVELMGKIDENGDGTVDLDEFSNFLMHSGRQKKKRKSSLLRSIEAEHGELPSWQAQKKLEDEMRPALQQGNTRIRQTDHGGGANLNSMNSVIRMKHKLLAASYKVATSGGGGQRDLESLFAKFDSNGDGVLESSEMRAGLEKLLGKIDDAEFKSLMQQLDENGDGTVDLDEFVSFVTKLEGSRKLKRSELEEALVAEHGELPSWQAQKKLEDEMRPALQQGNTRIRQTDHGGGANLNSMNSVIRMKHKLLAASYKVATSGGGGQRDLESLFAKFDSNGDGVLESSEMRAGLEKLLGKIDDAEFKSLMQQLDENGDGTVDLDEFVSFVTKLEGSRKLKRSELEEALVAEHGELPSWQAQKKLEDEMRPALQQGNTRIRQTDHGGGANLNSMNSVIRMKHKLLAASYKVATSGGGGQRDLESLFAKFDSNGDGVLESSEMRAGLEKLLGKIDDAEFKSLMQQLDENGDGTVDLDEFVSFVTKLEGSRKLKRSELEEALVAEHGELPSWQAQKKLEDEMRPALQQGNTRIRQTDHGGGANLNSMNSVIRMKHKLLAASYKVATSGGGGQRDLESLFAKFDSNGDGVLESSEMRAGLEKLLGKIDDAEFKSLMQQLDENGDGTVDLDEFVSFVTKLEGSRKLKRSELEEALVAEHGELPSWQAQKKLEDEMRPALQQGNTRIRQTDHGGGANLNSMNSVIRMKHKLLAASYKVATSGGGGQRDLESLFAKFDSNGDGVLESSEMRAGLEKLLGKIDDAEFKSLMQQLDENGDGTVDLDEFVSFVTKLEGSRKLKRSELEEALVAEHGELPSWQAQKKLDDTVRVDVDLQGKTDDLRSAVLIEPSTKAKIKMQARATRQQVAAKGRRTEVAVQRSTEARSRLDLAMADIKHTGQEASEQLVFAQNVIDKNLQIQQRK